MVPPTFASGGKKAKTLGVQRWLDENEREDYLLRILILFSMYIKTIKHVTIIL